MTSLLPMCGFIAQLVEHRTGIAEVMGSNPVEALIFFRLLLSNCLNWKIYCDDHTSLSLPADNVIQPLNNRGPRSTTYLASLQSISSIDDCPVCCFDEYYVFQCTVLQKFKEAIFDEDETPLALKPVLLKLCSLYGLSSLETHLTTLYQGNATTGKDCCRFLTNACASSDNELTVDI